MAGGGAEGVDRAVRVRGEHAPVGDRRRRVEVLAAGPEVRERPRLPADRARFARRAPSACRCCRRRRPCPLANRRPSCRPRRRAASTRATLPVPSAERVEPVVPRADVDEAADDERRRLRGDRLPPDRAAVLTAASRSRAPGTPRGPRVQGVGMNVSITRSPRERRATPPSRTGTSASSATCPSSRRRRRRRPSAGSRTPSRSRPPAGTRRTSAPAASRAAGTGGRCLNGERCVRWLS